MHRERVARTRGFDSSTSNAGLRFSNTLQVLHFCMWKFVWADKVQLALSARTKFHTQKCNTCRVLEKRSRTIRFSQYYSRNLLIVSWLTDDTDARICSSTANFPGNWYSQLRILCPFGKSAQQLPVEYHVETLFMSFSVSTSKKGCSMGQDLEICGNPNSKQQFRSDSIGIKII